jgi:hypothetical protein
LRRTCARQGHPFQSRGTRDKERPSH